MRQVRTTGFTLVELMIVVAIIGILAALAIPNFMKYQAKSKQAEAKQGLKAMFMAQRDYFAEWDGYADDLGSLSFTPERGNRYAYQIRATPTSWQVRSSALIGVLTAYDAIEVDCFKIGGTCAGQPTRPPTVAPHTIVYDPGTMGTPSTGIVTGNNGSFTMEALGTIDNDPDTDVWLVSSGTVEVSASACSDPEHGVPGVAVAIYNDVACP